MKIDPFEFEEQVMKMINNMIADKFAELGGDLLGGECYYNPDEEVYVFIPNESYCGTFGDLTS